MPDKILVTGASGNVGAEVVSQLAAFGVAVRAMVRNRGKAAAIEGPGIDIVEADLSKPETLGPAVQGVNKVVLISSPDPNQATLQNNMVVAAKRGGVTHIVKISAMGTGADSPVSFGRWHAATEQYLAESGIPFTFLRPNFFMQNTLSFAHTIASEGKFYASMKNGKASFVDVRDIGAVATQVAAGTGHEGKTYLVTGPEALSFADVARIFSVELRKAVEYMDLSGETLIQAMTSNGMPDWMARGIEELYEWGSEGGASVVTNVVEKIGNKRPITYHQFVRNYASAFESTSAAP